MTKNSVSLQLYLWTLGVTIALCATIYSLTVANFQTKAADLSDRVSKVEAIGNTVQVISENITLLCFANHIQCKTNIYGF